MSVDARAEIGPDPTPGVHGASTSNRVSTPLRSGISQSSSGDQQPLTDVVPCLFLPLTPEEENDPLVIALKNDHQIRGRIGRGNEILLAVCTNENPGELLTARLARVSEEGLVVEKLSIVCETDMLEIPGVPRTSEVLIDAGRCCVLTNELPTPDRGLKLKALKNLLGVESSAEYQGVVEAYYALELFLNSDFAEISLQQIRNLCRYAGKMFPEFREDSLYLKIIINDQDNRYIKERLDRQTRAEITASLEKLRSLLLRPLPGSNLARNLGATLDLTEIYRGPFSGEKCVTVLNIIREICGKQFPEETWYKIWKLMVGDLSTVLQSLNSQGFSHLDLRLRHVLLSTETADVIIALLGQLIIIDQNSRCGHSDGAVSSEISSHKEEVIVAAFETAFSSLSKVHPTRPKPPRMQILCPLGITRSSEGADLVSGMSFGHMALDLLSSGMSPPCRTRKTGRSVATKIAAYSQEAASARRFQSNGGKWLELDSVKPSVPGLFASLRRRFLSTVSTNTPPSTLERAPLSVAECHQDLWKLLSRQPKTAAIMQRCTRLIKDSSENKCPEVSWEVIQDAFQDSTQQE